MAVPLTPEWIQQYQNSIAGRLNPIQRLAIEAVWTWFETVWELAQGQVNTDPFEEFTRIVMPEFRRVERFAAGHGSEKELDEAIVSLVTLLRTQGWGDRLIPAIGRPIPGWRD